MAGNNIVEDIGGGHYVGYAHFRPGTITVKKGDSIHVGQVLGKLATVGIRRGRIFIFRFAMAHRFSPAMESRCSSKI